LDIKPSTGEDSYSNLFPPMKAEKQKLWPPSSEVCRTPEEGIRAVCCPRNPVKLSM
jgi:hypothetical protein